MAPRRDAPHVADSCMPAAPLRVLSLIPPMTQLNTPYPSTAYITGFLRSRGVDAAQEDLALALVLLLIAASRGQGDLTVSRDSLWSHALVRSRTSTILPWGTRKVTPGES